MNWFKPMLLMMVLGGIAYGVYIVLNKGPAPEPPPGISKDWARPVDIQLGSASSDPGSATLAPAAIGPGAPPPLSAAPPFGPGATIPPASSSAPGPTGGSLSGSAAVNPFPMTSSPNSSSPGSNPLPSTMASPTMISPPTAGSTAMAPAAATPSATIQPPTASAFDATATNRSAAGGSSAPAESLSPSAEPASTTATSDADITPTANISYAAAMDAIQPLLNSGKLAEALRLLTHWYGNPQLTSDDAAKIDDLLGRLAGTVIYSRKHLLLPPYVVQPGDRLQAVAEQYKVPWQLLGKINGITDPEHLSPNEKLKVIRGPFMAWVNPDKKELTLFVQECYAGRFKLTNVGREASQATGMFDVKEKQLDPSGHIPPEAAAAAQLAVHHCVNFGDKMSIRGVNGSTAADDPRGLSLESRDAEDVFDILTVGSRVMIRR